MKDAIMLLAKSGEATENITEELVVIGHLLCSIFAFLVREVVCHWELPRFWKDFGLYQTSLEWMPSCNITASM
jgi:hypothetical protein